MTAIIQLIAFVYRSLRLLRIVIIGMEKTCPTELTSIRLKKGKTIMSSIPELFLELFLKIHKYNMTILGE